MDLGETKNKEPAPFPGLESSVTLEMSLIEKMPIVVGLMVEDWI